MILHTLDAAPDSGTTEQCLRSLDRGDVLLLVGRGVYGAMQGLSLPCPCPVYALAEDIDAAGVRSHLNDQVTVIDMAGFVRLSAQAQSQVAWY